MAVNELPFESQFGFKSPSFTVDEQGNITARSITLEVTDPVDPTDPTDPVDPNTIADFTFNEVGGNFRFENGVNDNPTITVYRNSARVIELNLTSLTFNIFEEDRVTLYNEGLLHSDGTSGADAQNKQTGRLQFTVPIDAPDVLYYGNATGTIYGLINVQNARGIFSAVDVTGGEESLGIASGALVVDGGVGISGDLNVGGELNLQGLGIPVLSSQTNLELSAQNKIIVKVADTLIGSIDATGSSIPINNTTIENTTIGTTTPSSAAFTDATVTNQPEEDNAVANKSYVDSTATVLAIALGF